MIRVNTSVAFFIAGFVGLEVVVKCLAVGDRLVVSGKLTDESARPYLQAKTLTPVFTLQLPLDRFLLPSPTLSVAFFNALDSSDANLLFFVDEQLHRLAGSVGFSSQRLGAARP